MPGLSGALPWQGGGLGVPLRSQRTSREKESLMKKLAAISVATGLGALMLMGNTKCGAVATGPAVAAGNGGVVVWYGGRPPGTGWNDLGKVQSGAHAGQHAWVEIGSAVIAGAALAKAAQVAAETGTTTSEVNAAAGDPCFNKKPHDTAKVWNWGPKIQSTFRRHGFQLLTAGFMNCRELNLIRKNYRLKHSQVMDVINCISKLIAGDSGAFTADNGIMKITSGDATVAFGTSGAAAEREASFLAAWPHGRDAGAWARCNA
jgi:hypothetical protein